MRSIHNSLKNNQDKGVANANSINSSKGRRYQFKDNRPEAVIQNRMQSLANNFSNASAIQRREGGPHGQDQLKSGLEHLSGADVSGIKAQDHTAQRIEITRSKGVENRENATQLKKSEVVNIPLNLGSKSLLIHGDSDVSQLVKATVSVDEKKLGFGNAEQGTKKNNHAERQAWASAETAVFNILGRTQASSVTINLLISEAPCEGIGPTRFKGCDVWIRSTLVGKIQNEVNRLGQPNEVILSVTTPDGVWDTFNIRPQAASASGSSKKKKKKKKKKVKSNKYS